LKIIKVYILVFLVSAGVVKTQSQFESTIDSVLFVSGLNAKDISLPFFDYKDETSSNHKLLTEEVKKSLLNPLGATGYINEIKKLRNSDYTVMLNFLLKSLTGKPRVKHESKYNSLNIKELCTLIRQNRNERENLLGVLNKSELKYLKDNILDVLLNPENYSMAADDIFRYNSLRDSGLIKTEKIIGLLCKIDTDKYYSNLLSDACLFNALFNFIKNNQNYFGNLKYDSFNTNRLQGSFSVLKCSDVEIVIGDSGKNIYHGNFDVIVDLGGNDIYETDNQDKTGQCWIIDLNGDDYYSALSDFCLAGSFLSSSFILDAEGNDIYKGNSVSLGSSVAGISALIDFNGDDKYTGGFISCGAGMFGAGLLYDNEGNDTYLSDGYSQGFGMTQGMGMIYDYNGGDKYIINPVVKDITRHEDHYKSMSQGFGLGLRPCYAGGIGIIFDISGNDLYNSDVYGQGSAYWFSSGYLIDVEGNDVYNSYQYSQGAGIHFASGFLIDDAGFDIYSSNGVSQGCGHDYGFGLLLDGIGNDNYSAYSLSQGAGNANGIGILSDLSGTDVYLTKDKSTTRGYGNPRRETVSLGIFIDAGIQNYYSVNGINGGFSIKPDNGIFAELPAEKEIKDNKITDYKIPVIEKDYSADELFVMAKTIEPRFSEWQKYGFNKLISDSTKTANVILEYLETDDARVKLVLFNLINRIGYTFSKEIAGYIPLIVNSNKSDYQKEEILSYACYLLGEYGNTAYTGLLISLTDYKSIKVKSSALNALSKLRDTGSKNAVEEKLLELIKIKTDYIPYYKDLVICLAGYDSDSLYLALLEFLNSDYHFTVRLPAAGLLKNLNKRYSHLIDESVLNKFAHDEISKYWLIYSLSEVNKDELNRIKSIFKKTSH